MTEQAAGLLALGMQAVLVKGGHLGTSDSPDLLARSGDLAWIGGPRHATRNTHGTGCTLSSALATLLGHGLALPEAAAGAKAYVSAAIAAASSLDVGHGHGPTHHFHACMG